MGGRKSDQGMQLPDQKDPTLEINKRWMRFVANGIAVEVGMAKKSLILTKHGSEGIWTELPEELLGPKEPPTTNAPPGFEVLEEIHRRIVLGFDTAKGYWMKVITTSTYVWKSYAQV
jgi:hypothetical protein